MASNTVMPDALLNFASRNCVPCRGIPPLSEEVVLDSLKDFPGWSLVGLRIQKEFTFDSYLRGLDFAHAVGKIAEAQDHHPDILVKWRKVSLTLSTHAIKGLSQNDFIMAAKSELEYLKYRKK